MVDSTGVVHFFLAPVAPHQPHRTARPVNGYSARAGLVSSRYNFTRLLNDTGTQKISIANEIQNRYSIMTLLEYRILSTGTNKNNAAIIAPPGTIYTRAHFRVDRQFEKSVDGESGASAPCPQHGLAA